jgi:hypothetical protein
MFNKYFGGYKKTEITDSQNNNFIKNKNENFLNNNIKENIYTDFYLGDKVILNNKYKKTIVNSYNKIINQPSFSRNNSINLLFIQKVNIEFLITVKVVFIKY